MDTPGDTVHKIVRRTDETIVNGESVRIDDLVELPHIIVTKEVFSSRLFIEVYVKDETKNMYNLMCICLPTDYIISDQHDNIYCRTKSPIYCYMKSPI